MLRVPPFVVTPTSSVPVEAARRADSMIWAVTASELFGLMTRSFTRSLGEGEQGGLPLASDRPHSSSRHDLPAVGMERLPAEVAALVGGEKDERAHQVLGHP